jgi:hypothetical protein
VYNDPGEEYIQVDTESLNFLAMLDSAPETVLVSNSEIGSVMSPLAIAVLTGLSVFSGKNISSSVDMPMELSYHRAKLLPHREDASAKLGVFRDNIVRFIYGQEDYQRQVNSREVKPIQNVEDYPGFDNFDNGLTVGTKVVSRAPEKSEKFNKVKLVKRVLADYNFPKVPPLPVLAVPVLAPGAAGGSDNLGEYVDLLLPSAGSLVESDVMDVDNLL